MNETLPSIEKSTIINQYNLKTQKTSKSAPKAYNYFKALKQLKDVNKQIQTINNKINALEQKRQEINRQPNFNNGRSIQIRKRVRSQQMQLKQRIFKKKREIQKDINIKRIKNWTKAKQNEKSVQIAKKIMSQQKLKLHDQIKQKSQQNEKQIQKQRQQILRNKRINHMKCLQQQKKHRQKMKMMQQSRIYSIKSFFVEEAQKIQIQIQQKLKQLEEVELLQKIAEKKQQQTLIKHRNIIHKRMQNKVKPISRSTNSVSALSNPHAFSTNSMAHNKK